MSEPVATWRDAAKAMLRGAEHLEPFQGDYFDNPHNPTAACAIGCAYYGFALDGVPHDGAYQPLSDNYDAAIHDLSNIYQERTHRGLIETNDNYGRTRVLQVVKELLEMEVIK